MVIECATCRLRPLVPGDAASLSEHANNRKIWLNVSDRFPHPFTIEDAEGFIAEKSGRRRPTDLGIEVDGAAVGDVELFLGAGVERITAVIGYWLGEAYWGRGIMSDAVAAMTRYGFENFELERITALVFTENHGSARVLEKAGFRREAVLRRSAIKEGRILDQYLYAILRDESDAHTRKS
ncbi:MAG: GNAT family N-acetyltransferase [Candidatus Eisenbacteria bacterium]|uniref:GNAT family N-acetyltransferase n=1 Tax=Eiseniibacteriota bacterium TaxID=2212470 RepID=A0A849SPI5_UNCEI|nr:GNAT family N-acetyltransferase [Candidatus Eisenbacteria bacterium]